MGSHALKFHRHSLQKSLAASGEDLHAKEYGQGGVVRGSFAYKNIKQEEKKGKLWAAMVEEQGA